MAAAPVLQPPIQTRLRRAGVEIMKITTAVAMVCVAIGALSVATASKAAIKHYDLNIPRQSLDAALKDLAQQTGLQVGRFSDAVRADAVVGPVTGNLSAEEALNSLLASTGLEYKALNDRAYIVATPRELSSQSGAAAKARSSADESTTPPPPQGSARQGGQKPSFWDRFRVARVDQAPAGAGVERSEADAAPRAQLEEVVVTGSRLKVRTEQGPQQVRIYSREELLESGQTTVTDFLDTLPEVSVAIGENGLQTKNGGTTIQLRGLPIGTTLVLINGRRVQTSGSQAAADFFDLNNIPMAAVDRIEILGDGASAVYGSDAIAGVVNVILRRNFTGVEAAAGYGSAADTRQWDASFSVGKQWSKGSASLLGTFQNRGELNATERRLTASNDYTALGGPDNNYPVCNPGNVFSLDGVTPLPGLGSATYAAVPVGYKGAPGIQEFQGTAGTLNTCSLVGTDSLIPATRRIGALLQGEYRLTSAVTVFTETLYSHTEEETFGPQPSLFGVPFFQSFSVSASNPFNPFGTTVGVAELWTSLPRMGVISDADFYRPLVGVKGKWGSHFDWEVSAFESVDNTRNHSVQGYQDSAAIQSALDSTDPGTALDPFVAGPPGSPSQLQSFFSDRLAEAVTGRDAEVTGFLRGDIAQLPGGSVQLVVGGEYAREALYSNEIDDDAVPPNTRTTFRRRRAAGFAEMRVPLLGPRADGQPETLALTVAGRYDDYNDFGGKGTPQIGIEWRPLGSLLLRGSYAKAFKAPPLYDLYAAQSVNSSYFVKDPVTGNTEQVTLLSGGNPDLRPETGQTRTIGLVYASRMIPDLSVSVTHWSIDEGNAIQNILPLVIVQNEGLFPGNVVRASACQNGPPCPIASIDDTLINFGTISVKGLDLQMAYRYSTRFGRWSPALAVTETYHYSAALAPGVPAVDAVGIAQDSANWAPRWKGAASLRWQGGDFSTKVTGRYVGRYQDYDSSQGLGNFWLFDLNVHYSPSQLPIPGGWLKSPYLEIGAVNLFNRAPQFSNYGADFLGYDPAQADIRGRFLYVHVGAAL